MWPVVKFGREKCDIYIGRPSEWGSPYIVGPDGPRDEVILFHEIWIQDRPELINKIRKNLKGKILGCHCKPLECHGDVLVRIANDWQLALPLYNE